MSDSWRVDPAEVDAIVTRTAGPLADMIEARATLQAAFASAASSAASGVVAAALDEFATHFAPLLAGVSTRLGSARSAATEVTSTYVAAGQEIAGRTRSVARSTGEDGEQSSPFDGLFAHSRRQCSVVDR